MARSRSRQALLHPDKTAQRPLSLPDERLDAKAGDRWTVDTVLPVVWFGIIGFGVLMYVLMDGFVLGIGILSLFAEDDTQLDHMMNTAAPIWDGNETWLVLGGAGLLAAFPKAYAVMLSALYLPVLLMLVALVLPRRVVRVPLQGDDARSASGACASRRARSPPRSRRA